MKEVIIDSLIDSAKAFGIILILYVIFSFFENKLAKNLEKKSKLSPIYASFSGIIPQCGVSVVAQDLYLKKHITMGTLIAVFLSCSDEAIPLLIVDGKFVDLIILILIKIVIGSLVGILMDFIISSKEVKHHSEECDHNDISTHVGCCHHTIEEESKWKEHLVHPLLHSLKLFAYVLLFNIIFGTIVYYIGEENIMNFLNQNKYFTPIYATLVGLIPNCASSILITQLFLSNVLSFGALTSGLLCNAGLGMIFIFKSKESIKNKIIILSTLILTSLIVGYCICLITTF